MTGQLVRYRKCRTAFGSPGVDINLGSNELTALDVVGYNLVSVPEPGISALLLSGLIAIGILRLAQCCRMWRERVAA